MIQVDKIFIDKEGIKIPWKVCEEMRDIYQQKIDNANDPRKIPYREGQKAVYDALLSYRDNYLDEINKEAEKEIKMSGTIMGLTSNTDYRNIFLDCGGAVTLYDYILDKCGGYKEGDRVVISIAPCGKDEYYYPPRPKDTILSTLPSSAPEQTAAEEE